MQVTRQSASHSNFSSGTSGNITFNQKGWRVTLIAIIYDPSNTTGTPTVGGNNMTQVETTISNITVWIYQNPQSSTFHWSRSVDSGSPSVSLITYCGTKQTGGVNVSASGTGTSATVTGNATTTVDKCLGLLITQTANSPSASTNSTALDSATPNVNSWDSTGYGDVPTGSFSMSVTQTSGAYGWIILFLEPYVYSGSSGTEVIDDSCTFRTPPSATSILVRCWGGGGSTGQRTSSGGNGGGGGGAYAEKTVTVTGNTNYTVVVKGANNDTYFNDVSTVLAKGGANVANNTNTKGLGGKAVDCVGDVCYDGGDGADGGGSGTNSGGGGGGAGTTGAGTNGSGTTAGTGHATNGGNGGGGFTSNSNASGGSDYGGGAGGAYRSSGTRSDAAGGAGRMEVYWQSVISSTLTETINHTASLIKSPKRTLSQTATMTASFLSVKTITKTLSEVATITASLLRVISRTLTQTVTYTDFILKKGYRIFSETITHTATFASLKIITTDLILEIVNYTDTISRVMQRVFTQTVTYTDTFLTARLRTLSETVTVTASLVRTIGRKLSQTVTMTASVLKSTVRTLTQTVTHTATFASLKTRMKTLTEAITHTATLSYIRTLNRTFSEVLSLTASLIVKWNGIVTNFWAKQRRRNGTDDWDRTPKN